VEILFAWVVVAIVAFDIHKTVGWKNHRLVKGKKMGIIEHPMWEVFNKQVGKKYVPSDRVDIYEVTEMLVHAYDMGRLGVGQTRASTNKALQAIRKLKAVVQGKSGHGRSFGQKDFNKFGQCKPGEHDVRGIIQGGRCIGWTPCLTCGHIDNEPRPTTGTIEVQGNFK